MLVEWYVRHDKERASCSLPMWSLIPFKSLLLCKESVSGNLIMIFGM